MKENPSDCAVLEHNTSSDSIDLMSATQSFRYLRPVQNIAE